MLHNPIGRPVYEMVHFPVYDVNFEVLALASDPVQSQVHVVRITLLKLLIYHFEGYLKGTFCHPNVPYAF